MQTASVMHLSRGLPGRVEGILYNDEPVYEVVDGTAPSPPNDLRVSALTQLEPVKCQSWVTPGTLNAQDEELTIDLGAAEEIGAVGLEVGRPPLGFPDEFEIRVSTDDVDYESVAIASSFRAIPDGHIWQFEVGDYRYVKIIAESTFNPRTRHYQVSIPKVCVYRPGGDSRIEATWTATADDDNDYGTGPASQYQATYGNAPNPVPEEDLPDPPADPGDDEEASFSAGDLTGTVPVRLRIGDEVPNWSAWVERNARHVGPLLFNVEAPGDDHPVDPGAPPTFEFSVPSHVRPAWICFSSVPGFVGRPERRPDGGLDRTICLPLRPGEDSWVPSLGQWRQIKRIAPESGTVYWRLKGRSRKLGWIYGPARSLHFECGDIVDLTVSPSHDKDGDEAVWPKPDEPPTFCWTDNTEGMERFSIDVSTDPSMPLRAPRRTVTIGRGRIEGSSYTPNRGEWRRILMLATWQRRLPERVWGEPAEGVLYWRVRATDRFRALSCVSAVKKLIIDGGEIVITDPLDFTEPQPEVAWTYTGEGLEGFFIELSVADDFEPHPLYTLKIPARPFPGSSYTFSEREVDRIRRFVDRYNRLATLDRDPDTQPVSALHYRAGGQTPDRQFTAYSGAKQTPVP